ncbi:hypothetical protein SAMN02745673_04071 [Marinactinospora thermotolerans DSM 45154]|uniref:Uncharacterized protein n=1 Tax=Marinactinospora thermotolerans DSM 45154 TaxID=1122192 RepID=A0A1T4SXR0_9ACTN|nr:hypothetical protein [Marinactinospora thermotolerans]SKA32711.1 hypothetical protein SAMN02745673_04071 [Marinactinospora thermotolerans DSM 45154]
MSAVPTRPEDPAAPGAATPDAASPIRQMSLWPPPRSTRHAGRRRRSMLLMGVAAGAALLAAGGVTVWALSSGGDDATGVPAAYAGEWSGEMSQHDQDGTHVADWEATVHLEAGAERGSSQFVSLGCRVSLELTAREDDRIVFDYVETYDGDERCIDSGTLELRPGAEEGTLEAEWGASSHSGSHMTSTGTMTR